MKKNEALAVFNSKIVNSQFDCENLLDKESIEREIRIFSNNDGGFENVVFELGCSVLAKFYMKGRNMQ